MVNKTLRGSIFQQFYCIINEAISDNLDCAVLL